MTDDQGIKKNPSGFIFGQEGVVSVVRTQYDDDDDDYRDGLWNLEDSEQAPLLSTEQEGGNNFFTSRLARFQNGSDHSLHTLQNKPLFSLLQGPIASTTTGDDADDEHGTSTEIGQKKKFSETWIVWTVQNGVHPSTWTKKTYLKAFFLIILLTLVILAFTVLRVQDHIKDILHYIDEHRSMGAVLFVTFYTIACWLFLPGSLFTIGAGFLFKPMPFALAIVILGDFLGALGTFLFGRYIFHDWVKGMMSKHPKFNALDEVIKDDGWKIVVMLRLTPIPFNLITYFFSITSISLYTLLAGTVAGVFPGSCLGIWIGSMLQGLSGIDNPNLEPKNVVILIMNGGFIVCSILTLSIFGKRSLRKAFSKLDHHQDLLAVRASDDEEEEDEVEEGEVVQQDQRIEVDLESASVDGTNVVSSSTRVTTTTTTSTGFTRVEKWMFFGIVVGAIVNVSVSVPLYYHYANQEKQGELF
ncbi:hypothetical protein BGZ46_009872 [Entomortierella lignicola]|nr:hypothetical protein BGZ46_009872 [Entomortierella lignicola]